MTQIPALPLRFDSIASVVAWEASKDPSLTVQPFLRDVTGVRYNPQYLDAPFEISFWFDGDVHPSSKGLAYNADIPKGGKGVLLVLVLVLVGITLADVGLLNHCQHLSAMVSKIVKV